ncbi:hypothetical protein DRO03_08070 [Methanosarcinales archaeon]|nr:MAG: hypothetical protein DRO03_08070 [Methanosarcinales archaeon]
MSWVSGVWRPQNSSITPNELTDLLTRGFMWGEFQFISMEIGELCHDRCVVFLLEGRMQDIGTAKPNTSGAMYAGFRLKSKVW